MFIRLSKTGQKKKIENEAFHETEPQFTDSLSHIDVSPVGHQVKLSISHMKSLIGFVPRKHPA